MSCCMARYTQHLAWHHRSGRSSSKQRPERAADWRATHAAMLMRLASDQLSQRSPTCSDRCALCPPAVRSWPPQSPLFWSDGYIRAVAPRRAGSGGGSCSYDRNCRCVVGQCRAAADGGERPRVRLDTRRGFGRFCAGHIGSWAAHNFHGSCAGRLGECDPADRGRRRNGMGSASDHSSLVFWSSAPQPSIALLVDVKIAASGGRRRRAGFYSAIRRDVGPNHSPGTRSRVRRAQVLASGETSRS